MAQINPYDVIRTNKGYMKINGIELAELRELKVTITPNTKTLPIMNSASEGEVTMSYMEDLSENLPKIVEKLVNNKIIDTRSKVEVETNLVNNKPIEAGKSWIGGKINQFVNWFNPEMYATDQTGMTDLQVIKLINSSDLTIKQKNDMTDLIKNDNSPSYSIHIEKIEANNFDEIMESIKQAQANRRNNT